MRTPSYSDIRDEIDRACADLTTPAARQDVVERLAALTFEVNRIKEQQRTLLAALRARDILLRERQEGEIVTPAGPLVLDPRDALDASDGLYDIDWDRDVPYRWTGPGHDTLIRVWLDRTIPIFCELALLSYGDARNRGAVTLTVDGNPVAIAEAGDMLLRSEPFPIVGASLYSEIGLHVPWLTGAATKNDGAAGAPTTGGRRRRRAPASPRGEPLGDARIRGIAFTHLLFLSPT